MKRIVSLVPSSTETLLDLEAEVIACTRFCEQPQLRDVGGTKNPDIDAIVALAPDLVVLDREENRIEDHDALVAAGLDVFVSDVRDVEAGVRVVSELATVAGVVPSTSLGGRDAAPLVAVDRRRTAFVPIWRRPWMSISPETYGASVLSAIGIDVVTFGEPGPDGPTYPTVELAEVATRAPDLVLVPSEPYEFSEVHVQELRDACASSRVVRIDGQDLFWWGSRTLPAITRLRRVIGPQRPA
ncbi:MAG: helical backbone metal receptor [Ilumatobacter sp.]|jgi:ABC-type Fe3+-hydroxamate transport system substrate-binding protein|uniref:helical backbone metal receptor n=1 Tax=Ilumatobacter sp. TaxID=1967498 RepID=UPI00391995C3